MNHFCKEHIKYFDKVTFNRLKDSVTDVLSRVKSTSLSEMFTIVLKFTFDVFVKWFNEVFKSRFHKLNELEKKKSCDSKLAISIKEWHQTEKPTTWYNFVVQKEYLFLRNIYP